ncbi:MAG: UbiD family decarboxylase [Planctomycetes bacterium]|nr:UbiD family decarboxylase [Planctomycetota bacterium]
MGPFRDLRSYLDALRARGDLVEITAEVDPRLEIAEIHRRVIAKGGPALLFRNPRGADFPLVTNLYGTAERVNLAFGARPKQFLERVVEAAETLLPPTLGKLWSFRDLAAPALRVGMKRVGSGPVTEVEEAPRLDRLPALTSWHSDGGPFFTLPLVLTHHPHTQKPNLGMYRMQIHGPAETGLHFQIHKGCGFHLYEAEKAGQALPVTVFLGGPPALTLAAIAPLPEDVPELLLASMVLGERLPRVHDKGPHPLIASAEFAFVGEAPPGVRRAEGPFGDHYGYNSLVHDYPVFRVKKVFRRKDAIFPATVVGRPRQEDFHLGDYLQDLLAPLFPLVMPSVRKLWSYGETGFHSLAGAVVRDRYPREAIASGFRILGEGQLSLTKFVLMTDRDVDLADFRTTFETVLARVDWSRDLIVVSQTSQDSLDYTGPKVNHGSKAMLLGLGDAVRALPERFDSGAPLPDGVRAAKPFCRGCLVVAGRPYADEPGQAARIAAFEGFRDWPLIVLVDDAAEATATTELFLWTTFTRMEPAGDIHGRAQHVARFHVGLEPPVVFDCRMKPWYPEVLEVDAPTRDLVDRRWKEYGIPV